MYVIIWKNILNVILNILQIIHWRNKFCFALKKKKSLVGEDSYECFNLEFKKLKIKSNISHPGKFYPAIHILAL